ncbi:MAG TPA: SpoIIE family protein phosphatase [Candidatus Acidoferrales bacterium]|nr:SpoIIE family protein phosphatase [Candidatus Acidoferrales bacterium]
MELGFDNQYDAPAHAMLVRSVQKGSPAESAGLQAHDRIVAINGRPLDTVAPLEETWGRARPGDSVELTVERPGEPKPLILHGIFRASSSSSSQEGLVRTSTLEIIESYPVVFLVVGLTVLFLRLDDRNAWLLALLFAGFIAVPDFSGFGLLDPALKAFAMAYRVIFLGLFAPLFYLFFAVFPVRSPLDRRVPWLKWVAFALGACVVWPGLGVGHVRPPGVLIGLVGGRVATMAVLFYIYGFFALGVVSLTGNAFRASTPEACRRTRVILWGTVAGVVPIAVEKAAVDFAGLRPSFWLDAILIILTFLFPLSFAYAVVKHRVLEIPALLKRSARYMLVQRGFIVLLFIVAAVAIALFTRAFSRLFGSESNIGMAASAVSGIVMVWAAAPLVRRGTERIDRAFFRSAYDARVILQDLVEKTRTVTDRHELAKLLEIQIEGALHPKSFACYLEAGDGNLAAEWGPVPGESGTNPSALRRPKFPVRFGAVFLPRQLDTISATQPLLAEIAQRGKAWDVPRGHEAAGEPGPLAPECLVPILGRNSRLLGLLVLGQRLSEEPYSGEDKHLLDSVASQVGITLENIHLAEKMAERMEAERRAAVEIDIARRVQARLFPQNLPTLETMEYAGGCVQARQVGGDYYDFLDMGPGVVGMVLADISGKGMSGALLMANLQANLRSQYAVALDDLPRLLQSVNRLFYENTTDESYATMFFGVYDDSCRKLRYSNCGHIPPLLLRADGSVQRLTSTTTVLGLFREWECPTGSVTLYPGDTLVAYTDGITEAADSLGQEFGEARLTEAVRSQHDLPVSRLLSSIHAAVQQYSGGAQADDLTLVIGRVR